MKKILTPRFPDERARGEAPGFVRTGRAAKRRKQLERQREREARARAFVERVPRAYVAFDAAGTLVDWNERAAALFGWREEARAQPSLSQVLTRDSFRRLTELLAAGPATTSSQRTVLEVRSTGDLTVPVELAITRVSTGEPSVFAALLDFSAHPAEEVADLLTDAAAALTSTACPREATGALLEVVVARLGAAYAAVWLLDGTGARLEHFAGRVAADAGAAAFDRLSRRTTFAPGVGLPGRVIASGSVTCSPDLLGDDNFPRLRAALRCRLRSGFALPVRRAGRAIGVLEVFSSGRLELDGAVLRRLGALGDQLGLLLDVPHRSRRHER